MKVQIENYDRFFDLATKVQFVPVLDLRTGCFTGIADVSEKQAKAFKGRFGFRILTDEEYLEMTSVPEVVEPDAPNTGDPLSDMAKEQGQGEGMPSPPPPPNES